MVNKSKGISVNLNMFKNWWKDEIIGYKTSEDNGHLFITFIRCKVCARNKDLLFMHPNQKGSVEQAVTAYIDSANYVKKHNITRHLEGEGHETLS